MALHLLGTGLCHMAPLQLILPLTEIFVQTDKNNKTLRVFQSVSARVMHYQREYKNDGNIVDFAIWRGTADHHHVLRGRWGNCRLQWCAQGAAEHTAAVGSS
ncbi:unnamed protein product, partial [Meganyctiphanes norvegica]